MQGMTQFHLRIMTGVGCALRPLLIIDGRPTTDNVLAPWRIKQSAYDMKYTEIHFIICFEISLNVYLRTKGAYFSMVEFCKKIVHVQAPKEVGGICTVVIIDFPHAIIVNMSKPLLGEKTVSVCEK